MCNERYFTRNAQLKLKSSLKNRIYDLIRRDEIHDLINFVLESSKDQSIKENLILVSGRLENLITDMDKGILSYDEYFKVKSIIRNDVLELAKKIN